MKWPILTGETSTAIVATLSSTRAISCGLVVWLVAWTLGASQGAFRATDATALESRRTLAARGATPAAFGRRCIPSGCVAPSSNIPDILGRPALPGGRITGLGATPELHHGLLDLGQSPIIVGNRLRPDLTLRDLAGASRPLRRQPDEVTLLNFWATWCVPCLKELPELVKLSHAWQGRGLEVVGIAVDSGKPVDIRAFAEQHGIDYSLLVATQRWTSEQFGVFGLPVTVVVDRTGRIRQRLIGPQTGPSFVAAVRPYL